MITIQRKKESISHTILAFLFTLIPMFQIVIAYIIISINYKPSYGDGANEIIIRFGCATFYVVSSILNPALAGASYAITKGKLKRYIPAITLNSLLTVIELIILIRYSFS